MSDARHVTFDKNGKYLYCTASTDIGPTTNGIDMSGMNRPVTRSVYLVVLDKNQPSPLAPESDEEKDQPADKNRLLAKLAEKERDRIPAQLSRGLTVGIGGGSTGTGGAGFGTSRTTVSSFTTFR